MQSPPEVNLSSNTIVKTYGDDLHKGLKRAAILGDKTAVEYFVAQGASNINEAASAAAEHGQLEMVKLLTNRGDVKVVVTYR